MSNAINMRFVHSENKNKLDDQKRWRVAVDF